MSNFKSAMANGRARMTWIGAIVIALVFCGVAWALASGQEKVKSTDGSSELPQPPPIAPDAPPRDSRDGPGASPAYDQLLEEENRRKADAARQQGGSALPAIRSNATTTTPEPEAQRGPASAAAPTAATVQVAPPPPPPDLAREDSAKISAKVQAAKNQVSLLINSWVPKEHVALQTISARDRQAAPSAESSAGGASSVQAAAAPKQAPIRKAGDTCYATLDTAVNTDEPSPVTATIQQCGELDQAKMIGKVEVQGQSGAAQPGARPQRAVLRFTSINVKNQPTSLPIDAVAIDEETRRAALASDVDNHYFLRYGTMFAASFLGGIGDALLRAGQRETVIATTTGPIVSRQAFDTSQLALAGAASVGKQITSSSSGVFNRPPTITIDAGIGIGILFMTDLTLK